MVLRAQLDAIGEARALVWKAILLGVLSSGMKHIPVTLCGDPVAVALCSELTAWAQQTLTN